MPRTPAAAEGTLARDRSTPRASWRLTRLRAQRPRRHTGGKEEEEEEEVEEEEQAGAKGEARYPNLCSGENFGYFGFTLTRSLYDSQALQAYSQNSHTHSPYAGRHTLGQQRHRSHHHLALVKGTTVGCAHCGQVLSATLACRAHDS